MTITVITGATRGLGRETARRLVAAGHTVYLGARDAERGRRVSDELGARPLPLDVTCERSVQAAAAHVREVSGRVDVLVNNAGIAGPHLSAPELDAESLARVFETNVFGAVRTLRAFLPLLGHSSEPVVVNVSSGLGSLAAACAPEQHRDTVPAWLPAPAYAASKAALNMLTVQYAHALPGVRINAVDPGHTATDFNGHTGTQTVEEGAEVIVRLATVGRDGPTAGFHQLKGTVPW